MKIRRLVAILAIGALATTAAACSSDSKDDKSTKGDKTEQTNGDSAGSGDDASNDADSDDPGAEKVSDEEFAAQMADLGKNIDSAGSDVCKLMEALQVNPAQPSSEAQVKEFIGIWTQLLDSIADTLGGDDAKVVRKAANDFKELVEARKYDPGVFDDEEAISKVLDSPEMAAAMERFGEMSMKCFDDDEGDEPVDANPED